MLVGQKGRAASLLLGSLRLAKLLVKLHLWQFFSKESNMQMAGWIAAFGHIQTCRARESISKCSSTYSSQVWCCPAWCCHNMLQPRISKVFKQARLPYWKFPHSWNLKKLKGFHWNDECYQTGADLTLCSQNKPHFAKTEMLMVKLHC